MIDINSLIKEAYKAKDNIALNAYRNIKSEFQKVQTSKNAPEWNDKLEMQIISKYGRKLEDSICQFSEAHRDDLVAEYTSELEVVKKLLPKPVNESDILLELDNYGRQNSMIVFGECPIEAEYLAIPKKEMGTVIKHLKSKFPTADGKMISEIVKKYIV